MKKLFFFSALIIFINSINGQLLKEWSRTYIVNDETARPAIKFDFEQNLIVSSGKVIVKYDTLGNELWSKQFDSAVNDLFLTDDSCNIYITRTLITYQTHHNSDIISDTTMYVVKSTKYDKFGNEKWFKTYQYYFNYPRDQVASITLDTMNNLYIAGTSIDSLDVGNTFLLKYTMSDGTEKWRRIHNDPENAAFSSDNGISAKCDLSGNIYLGANSRTANMWEYYLLKYDSSGILLHTGRYENPDVYMNQLEKMVITSNNDIVMTGLYYTTASFDSTCNLKWAYTPPVYLPENIIGRDDIQDIIADNNGNVYVTGLHCFYVDEDEDNDIYSLKFDALGNLKWEDRYGPNDIKKQGRGYTIGIDLLEFIYIAGISFSYVNGYTNHNSILLKYNNQTGENVWSFIDEQNPSAFDEITSIQIDKNSNIYSVGVNELPSGYQLLVSKYLQVPYTSSNNDITDNESIKVYPNPAKSVVFIDLTNLASNGRINLKVINSVGQIVLLKNNIEKKIIQINQLQKGIYIVNIETDQKILLKKLIIN
jgi:hypothetical protein